MSHTVLLQKLLVIESAIGKVPNGAVRDLVQEAQLYLLNLQKERAETSLGLQNRKDLADSVTFTA